MQLQDERKAFKFRDLVPPGFNGLSKCNCKTRWETFKFGELVPLILEVWRYLARKFCGQSRVATVRDAMHPGTLDQYYSDAMGAMAFQITGVSIVCSTVWSGTDQRKHQNSASLAFVKGIHRWPVDSPHKRAVTQKMFSFGDVVMHLHNMYGRICSQPLAPWMCNSRWSTLYIERGIDIYIFTHFSSWYIHIWHSYLPFWCVA